MKLADLIIGVDGGGSKTIAWLAIRDDPTETGVIGRGYAGPSNLQAIGLDAMANAVNQAIGDAFLAARTPRRQVAAVCLGLAGAGRESDRAAIEAWARQRDIAAKVTIAHDALPVLYAGTPDGWGIALVSGTGSFAFGQTASGTTTRCGGWGPLFGDEGSGYAIARAGLSAAAQSADGRSQKTILLERFLDHFGLEDPGELIPAVYAPDFTRSDVARLAPLVFTASDDGDTAAETIVQDASHQLAQAVQAVARRLEFSDPHVPLAMTGGVLLHQSGFCQRVRKALYVSGFTDDRTTTVRDPVAGALTIAHRSLSRG